ncbi:MAG: TetR/AcrR family transcriptional regulator [Bacteroidota bacterium]
MAKDSTTEQVIADAAERVFLEKGISGARMQEIADAAGINKALLHYYFRSKNKLFEYVFDRVFQDFVARLKSVFEDGNPIEVQVQTFIRQYVQIFDRKPDMPLFIQTELYRNPELINRFTFLQSVFPADYLRKEIAIKVEAGEWRPIRVSDFLTNLIGLCVYPYLAKPLLQHAFEMEDADYQFFLDNRIESVYAFFLQGLRV